MDFLECLNTVTITVVVQLGKFKGQVRFEKHLSLTNEAMLLPRSAHKNAVIDSNYLHTKVSMTICPKHIQVYINNSNPE